MPPRLYNTFLIKGLCCSLRSILPCQFCSVTILVTNPHTHSSPSARGNQPWFFRVIPDSVLQRVLRLSRHHGAPDRPIPRRRKRRPRGPGPTGWGLIPTPSTCNRMIPRAQLCPRGAQLPGSPGSHSIRVAPDNTKSGASVPNELRRHMNTCREENSDS